MTETVRIQTVTPQMAQKWLEGNVDNRKLRESRVVYHARMLQEDEWELTGDAIVFDDQGVLINGQHRLSAVVVAGVPARFVILRGVPSRTQEVMDQGLSRNLADQLHRRGIAYANFVAGALGWLYHFEYTEKTGNVNYSDSSERPTLRELLSLFDQNTELVEEAPTITKLVYYIKVRHGPTLAAKHRLIQVDAEEAEVFFERLQDGAGLAKNDPIWRLREFCLMDATTRKTTGRAPAFRYLALLFKAWNFWRDGETIQKLSWTYSGTKKEAWPVPR